ncbi:hypothetical protein T492DRAFT_229767 [Pavlovales sp. CCMP2436]|nr:hypothetical protein T492DRAFT_229767 [Pavlovales sp. CCMP2436]
MIRIIFNPMVLIILELLSRLLSLPPLLRSASQKFTLTKRSPPPFPAPQISQKPPLKIIIKPSPPLITACPYLSPSPLLCVAMVATPDSAGAGGLGRALGEFAMKTVFFFFLPAPCF